MASKYRDITTDVNSIMKVKEYRFHIPIYHIFWELQCAELPECIAVSKLPGLDLVSGSAMTTELGQVEWPKNPAQKTKCHHIQQKSSARCAKAGNLFNACVLLRANDVRGVHFRAIGILRSGIPFLVIIGNVLVYRPESTD
jgi:hypothetical protein